MVSVEFGPRFQKEIEKLKDAALKERIRKQIAKVVADPETGKPMRYARKGTREVYVPPFRISYGYLKDEEKLVFLDIYHKDEQ